MQICVEKMFHKQSSTPPTSPRSQTVAPSICNAVEIVMKWTYDKLPGFLLTKDTTIGQYIQYLRINICSKLNLQDLQLHSSNEVL